MFVKGMFYMLAFKEDKVKPQIDGKELLSKLETIINKDN